MRIGTILTKLTPKNQGDWFCAGVLCSSLVFMTLFALFFIVELGAIK
jgi:hypothetical protein